MSFEGWKEVEFRDIMLENVRNGVYKSSKFRGSGTKIVNMSELFSHDIIDSSIEMKRIQLNESELEKYSLREGDLLFARRSLVASGSGKCSIIRSLQEPVVFESSIIRVRLNSNKVNPWYVFYFFSSRIGKKLIESITREMAVSGITGKDLAKLKIPLSSLPEQKEVVKILSSIDKKIELNNRINKNLEEMAQAIFKSWFVDFEPFRDGEFVESELGMIPKGWEVKKLGEIAEINKRSLNKQFPYQEIQYIDISSVSEGKLKGSEVYHLSNAPSRAKRLVKHGDIIWSTVRPNRRSYLFIQHPEANVVVSTGFVVISPTISSSIYVYLTTITDRFVNYLINCAEGSAYPAVRPVVFKEAIVLLPPEDILMKFERLLSPVFSQIHTNELESKTLATLRDTLLPKLMSGEIRVPLD